MDFQIEVNNSLILVNEGETLLTALRRNGIKIPTLCHMNRFSPTGACRLCVVEVDGKRDLITSCSFPVEKGMKVFTNSPRVIRARKSIVEMLLSNHPDDCLYCERNGNCELQWLAEEMNVKERKFFANKNAQYPDNSSTSVFRDPAKCVLCSRCVRICEETQYVTAIDFTSRANNIKVNSAFNKGLNISSCINCGQCIMVCPTGALTDISHIEKVQANIDKKKKEVIFFVSPSVTASIIEHYGIKTEQNPAWLISAALKKMGASKVFDLGVASDLNIREEARLLIDRVKNGNKGPLYSSCCPAWVKFVEEFQPELIPSLSTAKSPQQIFGALLKTWYAKEEKVMPDNIFSVAVMPCVGKKFEASREEMTFKGISEVDAVLTIREFVRMVRSNGIDLRRIEPVPFDKPFSASSKNALKLGYLGGKAEAIAFELFENLKTSSRETFKFNVPKNLSGRKEFKLNIGKKTIGFAWVSGITNAKAYIDDLIADGRSDIHYIEVMTCLDGCVGGGGQPINRIPDKTKNRKKACQDLEKFSPWDNPGNNICLDSIFRTMEKSPDKETWPKLFHTRFIERNVPK
ncbi:MAG: [Fe-Fe] hydrogenase large subunit C-terminal domain-containing protein [Bacteroidales bacterium]|jgi:NADH-quinone oxidoreductase subunit G/NADP-reducing hydrogenase subunit HndD|nr:[Fe-Fe] hydrogenase large subunit C-terminal domain-containing protein [Bacteroidales bacterium]NLM91340.1 2Fe-2S iron-sulfur cluster binding domain-containing protein [Bacteroidales bacterium]